MQPTITSGIYRYIIFFVYSSGHYRDQCHTDLSPDAPVSWQVDTSPGSTLSSVNSPTTSHDHLAAQVDSGQVYSPQEEISRCLDETLVVASGISTESLYTIKK